MYHHQVTGLAEVTSTKLTKLEIVNRALFDGAHNDHVEAWLRSQIKVVGPNYDAAFWGAPDMCYQATIGDYDLDCKCGYGHNVEEAKDELMGQLGF